MNPNSANQRWSLWTFTVRPGRRVRRTFDKVRTNCARFARKGFGSSSEMRITSRPFAGRLNAIETEYVIVVRTEGHPVHDPTYVDWMVAQWRRFFVNGFGAGTTVTCAAKLEAGSAQNGRPADQLVMLPAIRVGEL